MPAGRPTSYKPSMCNEIIDLGKTGASKAEMAVEIGISRETFNEWEKSNQEFSDAVKQAVHASQAWWERKGREATFGDTPGFNATSFIFNMKNRFPGDWKDKVEQEQTVKGEMVHTVRRQIVKPNNAGS